MMYREGIETLREEFIRTARRREDERTLERDQRQKQDRERKRADNDDDLLANGTLLMLATQQQVAEFHKWLDDFDASIVEALMENERQLTELRLQQAELLDQAHELSDGTRVLRMRDGESVIDEHGAEIAPEVIRWEQIDPDRPYGDDWLALMARETEIHDHSAELHHLQEQSELARERSIQGDVTGSELDSIRADLEAMRDDVMSRQPGAELASEPDQPDHTTNAPAQNLPTMGL